MTRTEPEQLALVAGKKRRSSAQPVAIAELDPVARVLVDVTLPHLDRLFDYAVPAKFADAAQPGVRVRVRFAGRLVDGYLVERCAETDFDGRLGRLTSVVSDEPVLLPNLLALCRDIAERNAGSLIDVVRAAIPPRHARAEAQPSLPIAKPRHVIEHTWIDYVGGPALLERAAANQAPRAIWTSLPNSDSEVAALVAQMANTNRSVIVVVPDHRSLQRHAESFRRHFGEDTFVQLSADLGAEARYRAFTRVLRSESSIVLGTRAAVFAPARNLGLIVVLDDVDDALVDPHAPYWNARDVAARRAHLEDTALVIGGLTRSLEGQRWIDVGWAKPVVPRRDVLRQRTPRVVAITESDLARDPAAYAARIPHRAWEVTKSALQHGPVLVQVARRGYGLSLTCDRCRTPATCECGGPLQSAGTRVQCTICGADSHGWRCRECDSAKLRANAIGHERTAEELGRAFPGIRIRVSDGSRPINRIGAEPELVVSTAGVEPEAEGGYAAVLLLDATAQLARAGLHASEGTVARWFAAMSLARPDATVVIPADSALAEVQACVRWDPAWLALRQYEQRVAAGLPPVTVMASVTGSQASILDVTRNLPDGCRTVGPHSVDDQMRMVIITDAGNRLPLARSLHAGMAALSIRSTADLPTVRMDADVV